MELFSVEGTELENKNWRRCEEFLTMRLVLMTKHLPTYQRSGVNIFWDNQRGTRVMIPTWNFIGLIEIVILSPTQLFKQLFKDTHTYTHIYILTSAHTHATDQTKTQTHSRTHGKSDTDTQRNSDTDIQKTDQLIGRLSLTWDCWHLRYHYWIHVSWSLEVDLWIDTDQFKTDIDANIMLQ